MIEQHLDIPTVDGAMNSFVVRPEEGGPFPVVPFCIAGRLPSAFAGANTPLERVEKTPSSYASFANA